MLYRLLENFETYMRFYIDNAELYAKMGDDITINMGGAPGKHADHWNKPDGSFYKNDKDYPHADSIPDVTLWADQLVLNEKGYQALSAKLEPDGEFLPVNCEGFTYYIFNLFTMADDLDALDEENSEQDIIDGIHMGLKKLAFKVNKLKGTLLFKTRYDGCSRIFCSEEFKRIVEDSGLNGLVFRVDLEGEM